MSDEVSRILESHIHQEESLLHQISQIQSQRKDIRTEIGKEAVRQGARVIFGRTGGKFARLKMENAERERIEKMEAQIDSQHRGNVQRIRGFLGTISEWKKNLKEPNSYTLMTRLDRAQSGAKVVTRIRHTRTLLMNLKSKRLVYNTDLPLSPQIEAVLPPGSPYRGLMELRRVLSSATGYVKICDTYVNIKTLDILYSIPEEVPIKLLTEKTGGKKRAPTFLRACKDFKVERPGFEVRKGDGLHDRFILISNQGWSVGPSLKDFGNKVSVLTPLQEKGKREVEKIFDDLWKKAGVLIS